MRKKLFLSIGVICAGGFIPDSFAQEPAAPVSPAPALATSILADDAMPTMSEPPSTLYQASDDLFTRKKLTGDWFGARSALENKGISLNFAATQFYQGVTTGGIDRAWEYGGKLDYLLDVDGHKLGLWQGLFFSMHAETRYGRDTNIIDGTLLPNNITMEFPQPHRNITSITGYKVTQALSESLAVYAGRINTMDEFAVRYNPDLVGLPGRGGFQNTALVFNAIGGRTVPYSTFGTGIAVLKDMHPALSLSVFDPEERVNGDLDHLFRKGVVIVPDLILHTHFFDMPGLYNIGGTYSSAKYTSFDPESYFSSSLLQSLSAHAQGLPTETGSWSVFTNIYQSFWKDDNVKGRNWGLFFGGGISDGNPNPVRYSISTGLGGHSMIPCRNLDTFGVGYYYIGLSDTFKSLSQPFLPQRDEYGVEAFYNYAITPWCRATYDIQVGRPSTVGVNTSITTGVRLQLFF